MGRWYSVAKVSTCPHLMQRFGANPIIATVELRKEDSATNVTKTTSFLRSVQILHHQTRLGKVWHWCVTSPPVLMDAQGWRLQADDLLLRLDRQAWDVHLLLGQ